MLPQRPTRSCPAQRNGIQAAPVPAVGASLKGQLLAYACMALLVSCGGGGGGAGAGAGSVGPDQSVIPVTPTVTPSPAAPLVAPGTWVVMGSSTASGAGAKTLSWPDAVKANYASRLVTVANIAKGGTTTYEGLPTSSPLVAGRPAPDPTANVDAALAKSPALVLVAYPSNDTAFGYSVDETVRNLLTIRSSLQARAVAVIVLSTQPRKLPPAQLALLPQIDARVSAVVAPCFVAVREALAAPDGTLAPQYDSGDGVHPNDAGHAVIYSKVASVIDSGQCVRTN